MSALQKLQEIIELARSNFGVLKLTPEHLREIFSLINNRDVHLSEIDTNKLCDILVNQIRITKIDINMLFGDEFVGVIQKIIQHFMDKEISMDVTLLLESIFNSLLPENIEVLVDEALIQFVINFIQLKKGGILFQKYHTIAMDISVACPRWESKLIEHMDIDQLKKWLAIRATRQC